MPPYLTLSIIRYGSRIKWSKLGKGVAPSPTLWCVSYRKGSLRVTLDYGRQLYLLYYYHYYLLIRVFHISFSWWSFTRFWVIASLLKSPGLFLVFWPFSIILLFWMISTRPPTSNSSSPFNIPLVTVPKAPITIDIIVTGMFHSFFNSLARSKYLSFFFPFFQFYSVVSRDSKVDNFTNSLFLLLISIMVRVFFQWSETSGFNPWSSHTKCSKNGIWCYLA